jgi:hypothetical protein
MVDGRTERQKIHRPKRLEKFAVRLAWMSNVSSQTFSRALTDFHFFFSLPSFIHLPSHFSPGRLFSNSLVLVSFLFSFVGVLIGCCSSTLIYSTGLVLSPPHQNNPFQPLDFFILNFMFVFDTPGYQTIDAPCSLFSFRTCP